MTHSTSTDHTVMATMRLLHGPVNRSPWHQHEQHEQRPACQPNHAPQLSQLQHVACLSFPCALVVVQVVIKSQILAGGRGLGKFTNGLQGGVHIAKASEAAALAKRMLGGTLVTKQSGAAGAGAEAAGGVL